MGATGKADKGLLQEICFGVCRWYNRLDKIAGMLIEKPFRKKDADLHALTLIGLYQLFYLRTPDHAAISETVNACRQLRKHWATGVINGMLRKAQREKASLQTIPDETLAIQHAHPQWLITMLQSAWPNNYEGILSQNNQHPPMTLRVNSRKTSRDQYLKKLEEEQIRAKPCQYSDQGINLITPVPVSCLPGFEAGLFFVQDEAAQLAANLLDAQPGETILDACAAPGGKTTHILERQPEIKQLVALDESPARAEKIRENLQRLQLSAKIITHALEKPGWWDGSRFDRILLDAPCSATGIIRRHPDIKWLRKHKDIITLAEKQFNLLTAAWTLLKPGGTLVYATCSVLPQENEQVILRFLEQEPDAHEQIISVDWGVSTKAGRQLFPQSQGNDGFYYAKLTKPAIPD